tara:strand:+ start:296 stop:580 length:285 start_codon:yes stop_codon:yes gene_type:complete
MAKVGVSLSLTLVIIASELAFGKAGSFHQTWFQRDRKVLFKPSHICVTLVKDVTRTTYFMVGSRMLEKAKQIWSLSDGETNYEELSPGDKRCLY